MCKDELNAKQHAFCRAYVELGDGQASAVRAGYSKKTAAAQASRLLNHVNVKAELARLQSKADKKTIKTYEQLCEGLAKLFDGDCYDPATGVNISVNAGDRIRASNEIAKMRGYHSPEKHEIKSIIVAPPDGMKDGTQ